VYEKKIRKLERDHNLIDEEIIAAELNQLCSGTDIVQGHIRGD
tara:strand:+ start:660 stop:788 length:129 start_codon:yes stop_codon:yes gene_type:complete